MKKFETIDERTFLSTLWIFVTINYAYCDIFTLFYSEELKKILSGQMGGMTIDQNFLLAFSIVLEIPILMILLSRVLHFKVNRFTNIFAGFIMTVIQCWSLFSSSPTKHYVFFCIIEIATTSFIVWYAWKWTAFNPIKNNNK
jgi:Family of unknown function (DUF6326)